MKKVHITLVGGQPIPIYIGIKSLSYDKVVFIHSLDSLDVVEKVKNEFNIESESIEVDPVKVKDIKYLANRLYDEYLKYEVTINISGGTKVWSYYFIKAFDNSTKDKIIYIDQNNNIYDLEEGNIKIGDNIDLLARFRLHGNDIKDNYTDFKSYTKEDRTALRLIEELRHFNYNDFNLLFSKLTKDDKHHINVGDYLKSLSSGSKAICYKNENNEFCVDIEIVSKKGIKRLTLVSPNIKYLLFNSGWFEYKVATLLSSWDSAKAIYLNCVFTSKDKLSPKNEVDIIVDTGEKLLFVECKTQIHSPTDVDKFRSVVKNYGGMGSKALFVTETNMKDLAKIKCEEQRVLTFSLNESHGIFSIEKALHTMLEADLFNINTK